MATLGVAISCSGADGGSARLDCPERGPLMSTFGVARTGLDVVVDTPDFRGAPVAVDDLDGDGLPDVVIGNRYGGLTWYDNRGSLDFEPRSELADAAGLGAISAIATADLDNDGQPELVVVDNEEALIFELSGDGARLTRRIDSGATESILPLDVDGDGDLDLLFANLDHFDMEASTNRLFIRDLDGSYVRSDLAPFSVGWSWTATALDFDGDGDLDVHIANDTLTQDFGSEQRSGVMNPVDRLFRQDRSEGSSSLVDVAGELGLDSPRSSMGGLPMSLPNGGFGLFIPDFGVNKVFEIAEGAWIEIAGELGLDSSRRATDRCNAGSLRSDCLLISWGVAQEDFDLDGQLEIVVVNSRYSPNDPPTPVLWYEETVDGYEELTPSFGCHEALALIPADLDDDGDLDLVLGPRGGRLEVLENRQQSANPTLAIALEGRTSNRDGRGAVIELKYDGSRVVRRWIGAGGVAFSSRSPGVTVPAIGLDAFDIIWPSGIVQTMQRDASWETTTSLLVVEPEEAL